jgi:esterase/lipase superfamily enzyme
MKQLSSQRLLLFVTLALALGACVQGPYAIEVMPRPVIYEGGRAEAAFLKARERIFEHPGILYATSRPPAAPYGTYPFYLDDRGDAVRLGLAGLRIGSTELSGEGNIALEEYEERRPTISVSSVTEYGILERSLTVFSDPSKDADRSLGDDAFSKAVDERMHRSGRKEIDIYVHGYKVPFSDPILVTAELWHMMKYEGAFIAYSWPSTPNRWAYFADADTATFAAHGFRDFLDYLAENTSAKRINVIGYSAGTRMVLATLHQIALMGLGNGGKVLPLGNVILTGSDVDRGVFGVMLDDGLLDQMERLTLYTSERDQALNLLSFLGLRRRVGEAWGEGEMPETVATYLKRNERLVLINVSAAEGSTSGNGHGYFRKSPWVSSDIVATLLFALPPHERGLIQNEDDPIWIFPDDYPSKLRDMISLLLTTKQ